MGFGKLFKGVDRYEKKFGKRLSRNKYGKQLHGMHKGGKAGFKKFGKGYLKSYGVQVDEKTGKIDTSAAEEKKRAAMNKKYPGMFPPKKGKKGRRLISWECSRLWLLRLRR